MRPLQSIEKEAQALARVLKRAETKVVFAESCTGGLIAASLATVPGISSYLCGSAVTYREETKTQWLGVPRRFFRRTSTQEGVVSQEVAEAMARSVLQRTPEAQVAASITGHLGPNAPEDQDGEVWIAFAWREKGRKKTRVISEQLWVLPQREKRRGNFPKLRSERQKRASHAVLFLLRSLLTTRA